MNETDTLMNPGDERTQPPPGPPVYELRRYLIVLTAESLLLAPAVSGLPQRAMDSTVANVLAVSADAAEAWAQERLSKRGLLPLAAWPTQIKAMTKYLERSVLNSSAPLRPSHRPSRVDDTPILEEVRS